MAAVNGRDMLIEIYTGSDDVASNDSFDFGADTNFQVVGGFKSNSFDINGEAIDITNKDSNGFKQSLAGAGNLSVSIKGAGVFVNDTEFKGMHMHLIAKTHPYCRITVPGFAKYAGPFSISSLSMNGDDATAISYDISLDSAGVIRVAYE